MPGHVVIVDDDGSMCEMIAEDLRRRGYHASWYTSAEEAFRPIVEGECDVALTDLRMVGMSGIDLCERIVANRPDVPVVVMTAFGNLGTAVAAIRAGAYDFVTKPIELGILHLTLQRALRHGELQEKVKMLSAEVQRAERFDELLGESPPMHRLYDQLARVADSDASVLITGESGTGKELVAQALHRRSRRSSARFCAVNCSALPEALLESELFGHTRGAFTDAHIARKGLFLEADGGTLLLDEIGDCPLALQPKLLRALEQRCIRPVGAAQEIPFDVRIVAATNRDLEAAVEERRFREDLFFRINVIQLDLPPLRTRGNDVLLLGQQFVERFAAQTGRRVTGISQGAARKLLDYTWPGNVRELRNAIERAVALTRYEQIAVDDLPDRIRAHESTHVVIGSEDPRELVPMEEVERRYILHVLKAVAGNKALAARVLGIDRRTLYRKLKSYGHDGAETRE